MTELREDWMNDKNSVRNVLAGMMNNLSKLEELKIRAKSWGNSEDAEMYSEMHKNTLLGIAFIKGKLKEIVEIKEKFE